MKSISKSISNASTIYLLLRCSTEKQTQVIKATHPISLTFFSNFLSFDSRVFIFFVFCILSNNRSSHRKCSVKKVFLEISQNSQENTCVSGLQLLLKKETLAQVLSCEFCEISKNTFLIEHLGTTDSLEKLNSISCGICLLFKSRHLGLFCKAIIQLFST